MARRERWHDQTFLAALNGVKPGREPDWGLDDLPTSGPRRGRYTKKHEADFATMKAEYQAKNCDPQGRKFPGTL